MTVAVERVNRAKCLRCLEVIESKSRHDFRTCSCAGLSVDGGKDYVRRVWDAKPGYAGYQELSEGFGE